MIGRVIAGMRTLRALAGISVLLVLAPLWLLRPRRQGWPARVGLAAVLWGFRLRVRCRGAAIAPAGTLFVANHTSWTDIVVLARILDAAFIAKADIAGWPVVGALARRHGTLFIERERRGAVRAQADAVEKQLAAVTSLVLFAEGTTSDGSDVLPFRSSLFAQAAARGSMVQPVAIRALRRDGAPFSPAQRRSFAWIDDDLLLPHALALAAAEGALIEVWFEAPLVLADRKSLARESQGAIERRLKG